ncbi:MAG TPA: SRPBCC family protein [bacterium]|mgnify:FL=1|nr:SRPBCC family protein [bacterium]
MPKTARSIVVNAPLDKCYEIIKDIRSQPDFLDELKSVRIIEEKPDKVRAEFTVKVIKEISYTLDLWGENGKYWKWKLVKGFFKKNDGQWALKDLGNGTTEVTYEIDIEFGLLVPGSVVKMLQDVNLPKMLNVYKKRIESR